MVDIIPSLLSKHNKPLHTLEVSARGHQYLRGWDTFIWWWFSPSGCVRCLLAPSIPGWEHCFLLVRPQCALRSHPVVSWPRKGMASFSTFHVKWLSLYIFPLCVYTGFAAVTIPFGVTSSFTIALTAFGVVRYLHVEDICLPWLLSLRKTVGWPDTMDKTQSGDGQEGTALQSQHRGGRRRGALPPWLPQPSPSGQDFILSHAFQPGLLVINQKCIFYVALIYIYLMLKVICDHLSVFQHMESGNNRPQLHAVRRNCVFTRHNVVYWVLIITN